MEMSIYDAKTHLSSLIQQLVDEKEEQATLSVSGNVDNISVDTIIENINKIEEKEQKILTKSKYK